jgi:hypothetical protein
VTAQRPGSDNAHPLSVQVQSGGDAVTASNTAPLSLAQAKALEPMSRHAKRHAVMLASAQGRFFPLPRWGVDRHHQGRIRKSDWSRNWFGLSIEKRDFCDPHHIAGKRSRAIYRPRGAATQAIGRAAMATNSSALGRFPAETVAQAGLAALVFAAALAVAPAAAEPAAALIESLTSNFQRMELMDYVQAGQVIRLSPGQTMVLSYEASCVRETITGGTVTIGTEQSEVRSGEVRRTQGQCGKAAPISGAVAIAGRTYRGGVR